MRETTTLEYVNHLLPYQKAAGIKKQAEILGTGATAEEIIAKILDTHMAEVLVCIESGKEAPLTEGDPNALVTVMPLLDPKQWQMSLVFPLSGTRKQVLSQLKTLKLTKKR